MSGTLVLGHLAHSIQMGLTMAAGFEQDLIGSGAILNAGVLARSVTDVLGNSIDMDVDHPPDCGEWRQKAQQSDDSRSRRARPVNDG